jgi:P27 family predicted phage terminase small subunit
MGRRGFKPKPLELKRLHGSWRADVKQPKPIGDGTIPSCPKGLSAKSKEKWFEVIQQLRRISESLLSSVDVQMLARYCVIWELWDKARRFIEKNGEVLVVRDKNNKVKNIKPLPQTKLFLRYSQELLKIEAEFGMSPSARTRVGGESKIANEASKKSRFFKFNNFKE